MRFEVEGRWSNNSLIKYTRRPHHYRNNMFERGNKSTEPFGASVLQAKADLTVNSTS
jgi:hypothetical protein